jgi:hypothetical protein
MVCGVEWSRSEDSGSRSFVHGVEKLGLNWSRDRIGQSRECGSSREIGCWCGSGSDQRKSCLSGFLLLSLFLGLVLLVANSLGHDICQKLEVVYAGDGTS